MKCSKIINLVLILSLLISISTKFNIINAEDENTYAIPVNSLDGIKDLPVILADENIYVSLESILPYSDYISNGDYTVLSINNGLYHKLLIDYSNKSLKLGDTTFTFSNIINRDDVLYFPMSEICAWIGLELNMEDNILTITKNPYSVWNIFNMYNFDDYYFDYTKEAGDNTASTSLIYISYLTNTILNLKNNWRRITKTNLSDASVDDYKTILSKALLETNDFEEILEKQADDGETLNDSVYNIYDIYCYYLSDDEFVKFNEIAEPALDDNIGIIGEISGLLKGAMFLNDISNLNEDYKDMLAKVYESSAADPSDNLEKAISHVNDKYSGKIYETTKAVINEQILSKIEDELFLATPMNSLYLCTSLVNAGVNIVFPSISNTWDDISLIPALTKTLGSVNDIFRTQEANCRHGDYSLEENERLRLSAILYLRLCRIGYEMMKNAGIGSASYYQGIIDEIDQIVTQLHLARSSRIIDSIEQKTELINKNESILKELNFNSLGENYIITQDNNDGGVNNDVLSRFNYLVDYVYRPGDIHYENKKAWPHGGYQCYGFAREVFYQLFGTTFSDLDTNKYYVFKENQSDIKNVKVIGQLTGNQITLENVKNLLSYAKVGDVIQMANGANNRYHHTMIVGRYIYDDGLEIYENNWSPYMTELSKHTWRGICNYTGSYSNSGITLYRASNYEDISGEIDLGGIYNPPSGNNETSGNSSQETNSNTPAEVSVAFENIYALQNSTNPLDVTFYCDKINASKIGTFSEWGLTVWKGNNEIATVKDQNQSWNEDHMSTWFNSLKYNISLKENTEYKFRFYVVFDNNTYYSDTVTYKTTAKQNSTQDNSNANNTISFSNQYAKQNGTDPTDVTFYCDSVEAGAIGTFSEWGLTVWEGDKEIKTVKDTGQSWNEDHMNIWFNSKKYGISLKANTDYKFRFYVVYNKQTNYGDVQYFTTGSSKTQDVPSTSPTPNPSPEPADSVSFSNLYASQNGNDPLDVTFYCDSIKANKTGDFTEWGLTIWLNGSEVITVRDIGQTWREDHMNTWFNSVKYGMNLSADTDYSFTFYVVFNGNKYNSDAAYFRTGSKPQEVVTAKNVSFSNQYVSQNGSDPTDLTFYCDSVQANCLGTFSEWGVLVFDSAGNQIGAGRDVDQAWYEDHMNIWFNSKKYNIELSAGTDYRYQFFVIFDSKLYYSDVLSFTTNN